MLCPPCALRLEAAVLMVDGCFYRGTLLVCFLGLSKRLEQQAQTAPSGSFRHSIVQTFPLLEQSGPAEQMQPFGCAALEQPEAVLRLALTAHLITT